MVKTHLPTEESKTFVLQPEREKKVSHSFYNRIECIQLNRTKYTVEETKDKH